jgi:adenosylcobinamide kinase/adenosylcobinamide-phosphate guanylyltransferase
MLHLVLGGARSGKSSYSEKWLLEQKAHAPKNAIYVATAQALDNEMKQRIEHHQHQRESNQWQLTECPLLLSECLADFGENEFILIDCLTLWLTNQLMVAIESEQDESIICAHLKSKINALISALNDHPATIVLVANEVGLGVVPMGKESRIFVDHAGWLNQKIAQIAEQVTLVAAGLPLVLKSIGKTEGIQRG